MLVEASVDYLVRQLQAGVDAVQIFDTWAGVLPPEEFERWCIAADASGSSHGVREQGAGREDHRLSARRRQQCCRAMSSEIGGRCGRPRLDDRSRLSRASKCRAACRCRAISIRWRCRRRRGARSRGRCDAARPSPTARSSSISATASCRNADRACRADAEAGARQLIRRCSDWYLWLKALPHHRGHRLDGRACSICRGCSSITARPSRARSSPRPSR